MNLRTVSGYDLYVVASGLQKAIRRGDVELAGACALELYSSGFWKYCWKRLLTVSAEDCHGIITKEVWALLESFMFINDYKDQTGKGRIFISKAVILMCAGLKSRDSDHLQNLVVDKMDISRMEKYLSNIDTKDIQFPDYVYDVHTSVGKRRGKTKADFFREEFEAIAPKAPGLFDNLIGGI